MRTTYVAPLILKVTEYVPLRPSMQVAVVAKDGKFLNHEHQIL